MLGIWDFLVYRGLGSKLGLEMESHRYHCLDSGI